MVKSKKELAVHTAQWNFETLEPGVLTVGTYFINPPFEFIEEGNEVGIEIDLINEICKQLQLKSKFVNTTWENVFGQLEKDKYDAFIGGVTITLERQQILDFSIPYLTTNLSLVVNKKLTPKIHSFSDINGGVIGVQELTTDETDIRKMIERGDIKGSIKTYPFAKISDAITDLKKGLISGLVKVFPVADYFTQNNPDLTIVTHIPNDPQPLGIAFPQKNAALCQAVNQALTTIKQKDTFEKIYKKWCHLLHMKE